MDNDYSHGLYKCIVRDCPTIKGEGTLFRLPKDMKRFETWLLNVDRMDLMEKGSLYCYENRRICNLHFEDIMFTDVFKNKLKKNAVPNVLQPSNIVEENMNKSEESITITDDACCQTPFSLSSNTPRKRKLRQRLDTLSKHQTALINKFNECDSKTFSTNEFLNYCTKHFSPTFLEMIKAQHGLLGISANGRRYSTEYKQFALGLYFLSPLAYKSLSRNINLPSKSTLLAMTRKWKIEVGLSNRFVFQVLQFKAEKLPEEEKDCIICADEMSIKRFLFYNRTTDCIVGFHHTIHGNTDIAANSVMIFMARGISSNWKQPLAYFFVTDSCPVMDLKVMVESVIKSMNVSGFRVRGFVSDQGSNFYRLHNLLGVTTEKPYFMVSNSKVFYMFDVPHLLKSTRNNFLQYKFLFNNEEIRREYVDSFYAYDQSHSRRFAPKLTDLHLNPKNFDKMKVNLAAQLFSNSVVNGLECLMSSNDISSSALHTINFIDMMDKLFDILNSRFAGARKFLNRPFTKSSEQMAVIQKAKEFFSSLKIVDKNNKDFTKKVKFIHGWLLTIESVLGLFDELQYPMLCTRRLNQDCLENFNGKIRQQGGNSKNPTCIQFQRAFKKIFSLNCLDFNLDSNGSNCLQDDDDILLNVEYSEIEKIKPLVEPIPENHTILKDDSDYTSLELPEQNVHEYICGYFLQKCLKVHQCPICEKYAKGEQDLKQSRLLLQFKAYDSDKYGIFNNLCVPPHDFSEYIFKLDTLFENIFPQMGHKEFVGSIIKTELTPLRVFFIHPCAQFPYDYFLSLYVRFKIFSTLKFINNKLKVPENRKQKLNILMNK